MPTPTPPAPSLQGKTPARMTAEKRARELREACGGGGPCLGYSEYGLCVNCCAAAIRDAEAAARLAALEEAAQAIETNKAVTIGAVMDGAYFAEIVRSLASSPAPAKRAETEPANPEKETP